MNEERFNHIVEAQVDMALAMFQKKNDAYSGTQTVDRLAGVKGVAAVRGVSSLEAISGMMAKHTMSIYSMMRDGKDHPISVWNEKISDHINYLLLAAACVHEGLDQKTEENLANGVDPDRGFRKSDGQPDDLNAITINHFPGHPGQGSAGRGFFMEEEALQRSQSRRLRDEREGK